MDLLLKAKRLSKQIHNIELENNDLENNLKDYTKLEEGDFS